MAREAAEQEVAAANTTEANTTEAEDQEGYLSRDPREHPKHFFVPPTDGIGHICLACASANTETTEMMRQRLRGESDSLETLIMIEFREQAVCIFLIVIIE